MDEIPQFWNVLKGDMAVVGPRPERPNFVLELQKEIDGYRLRNRVKPGITGWAQVNRGSDHTVEDVREKVDFDIEYVQAPLSVVRPADHAEDAAGDVRAREVARVGTTTKTDGSQGEGPIRPASTHEKPGATRTMANGPRTSPAETVNVMLVSAHDWFASALQAVLEPEGFVFARMRSARVALRDASQVNPDMVIIDEGLPDMEAPALASSLGSAVLKPSIPILVYSPNFWHENEQAAAMRAGAWDIIKEPVRSNLVVAKLRRLLEIKQLIEATEEGSLSDMATGLFNLAGMLRMLRVMGSAARRHGAASDLRRPRTDGAARRSIRWTTRGSGRLVCGGRGSASPMSAAGSTEPNSGSWRSARMRQA